MIRQLKPVGAPLPAYRRGDTQWLAASGELHPLPTCEHAGEEVVEGDVYVRNKNLGQIGNQSCGE